MARKTIEEITFTPSSGNVFADLDLDRPEERLAKADLVCVIHHILERRKLTQAKAAALLGIDQPDVSRLLRGHSDRFSIERLFQFLVALDQDVTIDIGPATKRPVIQVVAHVMATVNQTARDRERSKKRLAKAALKHTRVARRIPTSAATKPLSNGKPRCAATSKR